MTVQHLQLLGFVVFTGLLVYVSRKPLRDKRSHGFTRFFAWEAILALLVLHAPMWHDDMFSPRQMMSWLLLAVSFYLAVIGVRALKTAGQPGVSRADDALYRFEKTERLVTTGVFRYIRHPMYAALIFLAWGVYLKDISVTSTALVLSASLFMWMTARRDELECTAYFGEAYSRYMLTSKRFIPFVL